MAKFFKFLTYEKGLSSVFKEYQQIAMKHIWSIGEKGGVTSGECWTHVNKILFPKTISRASVIFFLNDMVDHEILTFVLKTGKGGHHRVYYPAHDEIQFGHFLSKLIIGKLIVDFPEGAKKAIWELQRNR